MAYSKDSPSPVCNVLKCAEYHTSPDKVCANLVADTESNTEQGVGVGIMGLFCGIEHYAVSFLTSQAVLLLMVVPCSSPNLQNRCFIMN